MARMPPINHPSTQPKNCIRNLVGDVWWGVCNTPLPIRMKTIDRRRRGATAYAPQMGTIGPGWLPLDDCWLNWVRVFVPLSETSGRAYAIRPYPDGQKTRTGGVGRCPFFIRQTIRRPLCVRRNGIGPQAPGKTSCKDAPGNPSVRSGA